MNPMQSEIVAILSHYDVAWDAGDVLSDRQIQFRIGEQPVVVSFDTPERASELLIDKLHELGVRQKTEGRVSSNGNRFTVYHSGNNLIAVRCEKGLTIAPGNILVVPLHQPDKVTGLTPDQFRRLVYTIEEQQAEAEATTIEDVATEAAEPLPEPLAEPLEEAAPAPRERRQPQPTGLNEPSQEGDILRFLQRQHEPMKAVTIANWLRVPVKTTEASLNELLARGDVVVERGFWQVASRMAPQREVKQPLRQPLPVSQPPVSQPETKGVVGIPPQLGRILVAMAYATKIIGHADLTTAQVKPYLFQRDAIQYSARLPGAVQKGLAVRGQPLRETRGWHYRLTQKGLDVARKLDGTIFEQDGLEVPSWLQMLQA